MLTHTQMNLASQIATELFEDGMLIGEELEWYLRTSAIGIFQFKNKDHYLEFEEEVIRHFEKRRKQIQVLDTETEECIIFKDLVGVSKHISISSNRICAAINQNRLLVKRYKIEYINIPISELIYS